MSFFFSSSTSPRAANTNFPDEPESNFCYSFFHFDLFAVGIKCCSKFPIVPLACGLAVWATNTTTTRLGLELDDGGVMKVNKCRQKKIHRASTPKRNCPSLRIAMITIIWYPLRSKLCRSNDIHINLIIKYQRRGINRFIRCQCAIPCPITCKVYR